MQEVLLMNDKNVEVGIIIDIVLSKKGVHYVYNQRFI